MLSEVIGWYKRKNKKLMIFKVDFEKAFDSLSWEYLDYMMENLVFGSRWRGWFQACLHSARAYVLVNGSPSDEFSLARGLRQGDPLSPFLFILVMEGLHVFIQDAAEANLIRGVTIGGNEFKISHLLYADDVVFVSE